MPHSTASQGQLAGIRVLIAEDSWLTADLLAVQMEEEGAKVVGPAGTCARALDLIAREAVDVALVDLELGDALADDLVEELSRKSVPFVVMTAYGALPTNADEHAAAVIRKPVSRLQMINCLRDAMR